MYNTPQPEFLGFGRCYSLMLFHNANVPPWQQTNMADATNGFHVDELSKIRVLEPEVYQQTQELKEECKDFVDKISEFQSIVGNFIGMVDGLAKEVENEKMKAIGSRNLLKSVEKQRETEQQQLQALIAEKKVQLERYRRQYESLLKTEEDQKEFIEQFVLQK